MSCDLVKTPAPVNAKDKRRILFLDVETTGLIDRKITLTEETCHQFPYATQISCVLYGADTKKIERKLNYYIKIPDSVPVSPFITELTGVDRGMLQTQGVDIVCALTSVYDLYSECDLVVAHNYAFDSQVLMAEIVRNRAALPTYCRNMFDGKTDSWCTMAKGRDICKIWTTSPKGVRYMKVPKLAELYVHLFQKMSDRLVLHNSMVDTLLCFRCFMQTELDTYIPESGFLELVETLSGVNLQPIYTMGTRFNSVSVLC